MAAGSEKHWGGKRSVKLRWGCVPGKSSAEEWLRKERERCKGDTLRPTRRELADWQFGLGDMEDDAAGWVTMGRWQGRGQMTQGATREGLSKGEQLSVGWLQPETFSLGPWLFESYCQPAGRIRHVPLSFLYMLFLLGAFRLTQGKLRNKKACCNY